MTFEGETVIVRSVEAGGPAYRAGIKAGDRLHRIGDGEVKRLADVRAALARLRPADKAEVEWLRGDTPMKRELVVGSRLSAVKAKAEAGKGG
jgi:S1-C subfamily serine protease